MKIRLWLPNFDHRTKKLIVKKKLIYKGVKVSLINSISYYNDISLKRYIHSQLIGFSFLIKVFFTKEKPNLIISQIPSLELSFFACVISRYFKIPFVLDIRDTWPDILKSVFNKKFSFLYSIFFFDKILMMKYLVKNSTSITSISNTYLRWIKNKYKREKNSLDKVFNIGHQRINRKYINRNYKDFKILDSTKNKFVIFFSGSFSSMYNLNHIFDCAKRLLKEKVFDVCFLVVGGGNIDMEKELMKSKLPNIKFLGWKNSSELSYLMLNSDIGLAPYSKIATMSLPNKYFEYLAHELPILSSLKGEMANLINAKSLGYNYSGNINLLYKQIIFLKKNKKKLTTFKKNSKELFNNEYKNSMIYDKFSNHIKNLIN